jgi:hypothetical protein
MNAGSWRMIVMLATAVVVAEPTHSQNGSSDPPAVFTSTDGAFQFSYRRDFQVCTAGKLEPCRIQSNIPPCEDDAIVCVVYPGKRFEGTSFGAAAFQVREIHSKQETMTPDVCVTPRATETSAGHFSERPEFLISSQHPAEIIGGVLFVHGTTDEAAMSHSSSVDVYRAFHRPACYELSLSEAETNPNVSDPPMKTLTPAQKKKVDESLSQILHSFRFLK